MGTPEFVLRLREHVGTDQLSLVGVAGIVRNQRGEVLMARRSDNGEWGVITGILEPGEEPAAGLLREIHEETGVVAEVEGLASVMVTPEVVYPHGDRAVFLDLSFVCRHVSGEAHVGDDESTEVRWFALEEMPPMDAFGTERLRRALEFTGRTWYAVEGPQGVRTDAGAGSTGDSSGGSGVPLDEGLLDRCRGAILGSAVGDALGAGYEFGSAAVGPEGPQMIGGGLGGFEPGEWTDDTSMAWCVLDVAAQGLDLRSEEGLTAVARRFVEWARSGPADIGVQTRAVISGVDVTCSAADLRAAARSHHARTGRSAGNGSLMRTAPVALGCLDDPQRLAESARAVSDLTHADPLAGDACVLWSLAIRRAIVDEVLDVRGGLAMLPAEAAEQWWAWLDEAEAADPEHFSPNGFVVPALQAAWSAIVHTAAVPTTAERQLPDGLDVAIRVGDDTDTVAAIAGALLGARWGAAAVPADRRVMLHGYPGITGERLLELATQVVRGA